MNKKSIKVLSLIISLLLLTSSVNAYPTGYVIPVPNVKQQASLLCWAACCKSVLNNKGISVSQTQLSTYVFGQYSNRAANMTQTKNALSYYGAASTYTTAKLTMSQLIAQFYGSSRPALVGLIASSSIGHMVVLCGYSEGTENMVTYMDPADGAKYTISYSRFVSYWNECLYSIR